MIKPIYPSYLGLHLENLMRDNFTHLTNKYNAEYSRQAPDPYNG